MRVVEVSTYGGDEVLKTAEWPDPQAGGGKVRVRVRATTVTPVDPVMRRGDAGDLTSNVTPPLVLGWDFAGELLDPAPGFEAGQVVAGMFPWNTVGDGSGTDAEMVLADPSWFASVPAGADLTEVVTIPINGLAAQQALRAADIREGRSLVVTGASGTVGGFVVQLAAEAGAQVIAVGSSGDEEYVRSLGASEVLVHGGGMDPVSAVRERYPDGVDAVIDAAAAVPQMIGAVRDGGTFVSVFDPASPKTERGIQVENIHTEPNPAGLASLIERWVAGRLRTRVAGVLPLERAAEAHRRLAAGHVRGKLVLTP